MARARQDEATRFWSHVDRNGPDGCWLWLGHKSERGYGRFQLNGKSRRAHRVSVELARGPIPDGLVVDHLCRNTSCVNPQHLEAVTNRENCIRGDCGLHKKQRTHCPQGHPRTGSNIYIHPSSGKASCRLCNNERAKKARRQGGAR